jgi:hypothetical protein
LKTNHLATLVADVDVKKPFESLGLEKQAFFSLPAFDSITAINVVSFVNIFFLRKKFEATSKVGIGLWYRVARWFIFKTKIPIWVNFGVPYLDWKMLIYLFYVHL